MSTLTFDSHEAATAYKTAGFTDAQVEALVAIDRKTIALPGASTFATRADIGVVEAKLAAVEAKVMRAIEAAPGAGPA